MGMDKSSRINPRAKRATGGPGDSFGPKGSMAQGPIGTKVIRGGYSQYDKHKRPDSMVSTPTGTGVGGYGNNNKVMRDVGPFKLKQSLAGQTIDFSQYFSNPRVGVAGTYALAATPAGMTINSTTGVLSGTPTTVATTNTNLTVISAKTGDPNQVVAISIVVAA